MGTIETLTVGLATAAVLAIAIYAGVEFKRRLIRLRQPVRIDDKQERIAQRNRLNRW